MRTLGNSTLGVAMGMAKSRQRAFRFTLDNPTERDVVRASRFLLPPPTHIPRTRALRDTLAFWQPTLAHNRST